MTTRRNVLTWLGLGSVAGIASAVSPQANAQHAGHDMKATPIPAAKSPPPISPDLRQGKSGNGYTPVRTLNGWTLPYKMNNGVKEFHLVAEEIEHEFAPGSVAKCWGYNGTTPGPTIEAVEGDRVRIFVTNKLNDIEKIYLVCYEEEMTTIYRNALEK